MELLQVFREITMLKNRSSMHSSLKLTHTSPTVTASRCLSLRSELTCTKFGASGGRKTVKHLTACEKCGLAGCGKNGCFRQNYVCNRRNCSGRDCEGPTHEVLALYFVPSS